MKKLLKVLVFTVFLFASCSKDTNNTNTNLQGSWAIRSITALPTLSFDKTKTSYAKISFNANGIGKGSVGCNTITYNFKITNAI